MLNIGKLAAGGGAYYLETVASGAEDYYVGSGEAPGYWTGRVAGAFDLSGEVAADELRVVLAGADPRTGQPVTGAGPGRPRTVPGFDAAFRAPKSVALLWALADPDISVEVRRAHDEAVAQALGYLERNAAFVRRDGAQVPAAGFVAAAFRHRTSRAGDPLLHTHVLIANHSRFREGKEGWRALDARTLYSHARTGGFVYQAVLRAELTRRLGVAWGPVTNGYADLAGIPRALIEAFSTRSAEIRALLEERGERSARAAQAATLATRRAKPRLPSGSDVPVPGSRDYQVEPGGLRDGWKATAEPLGWTAARMRTLLAVAAPQPLDGRQAAAIAAGLGGAVGLTAHASTFTRRDVIRAWAERLAQGGTAVELEALADALLADGSGVTVALQPMTAASASTHPATAEVLERLVAAVPRSHRQAVAGSPLLAALLSAKLQQGRDPAALAAALLHRELNSADDCAGVLIWRTERLPSQATSPPPPTVGSVIRRADGRTLAAHTDEMRYSTPDLLALEQRLVDVAAARRCAGVAVAAPAAVDAALARRPTLAAEQVALVRRITTSGAGVEVVLGKAGAGKTYTLAAAYDAWRACGIPVVGAALAARAAEELQTGAGIPSGTVERLLLDADRTGCAVPPGGVLVVDEAAMVGTRALARVLADADSVHTKVVLVGDPAQLPEIDAGGAFRGLAARLHPAELTVNRRQRHAWDREALDRLRAGDPAAAFAAMHAAGRITIAATGDAARDSLVADWAAAPADGTDPTAHGVMLALRRAEVDDLNLRARAHLRRTDRLGLDAIEAAGRGFAVGDAVVCTRNAPAFAVVNGTRGTLITADPVTRSVTLLADGSTRRLPAVYLDDGHLAHGYALTAHKAEGATVERAWILGSDLLYQEWAYTALSRHREAAHLYLVAGEEPPDWLEHPETLVDPADPLTRLVRAAQVSHAQLLALDTGTALRPPQAKAPVSTQRLHARFAQALNYVGRQSHRPAAPGSSSDSTAPQASPDDYLTAALGSRPSAPSALRSWSAAADAVQRYRLRWTVTDPSSALGEPPVPPATLEQRVGYREAAAALHAAQQELGIAPHSQRRFGDLSDTLSTA